MNDITTFGLAQIKQEGHTFNLKTGESHKTTPEELSDARADKTSRWIELHYDSKEDMSHIDIEPFREVFQTQQACNNYTDDDMYLIIKDLANEFVKD